MHAWSSVGHGEKERQVEQDDDCEARGGCDGDGVQSGEFGVAYECRSHGAEQRCGDEDAVDHEGHNTAAKEGGLKNIATADIYCSAIEQCDDGLLANLQLLDGRPAVVAPTAALTGSCFGFGFGASSNNWTGQSTINNRVKITDLSKPITLPLSYYNKMTATYSVFDSGYGVSAQTFNIDSSIHANSNDATKSVYTLYGMIPVNHDVTVQTNSFMRNKTSPQPDWYSTNRDIVCNEYFVIAGFVLDFAKGTVTINANYIQMLVSLTFEI